MLPSSVKLVLLYAGKAGASGFYRQLQEILFPLVRRYNVGFSAVDGGLLSPERLVESVAAYYAVL